MSTPLARPCCVRSSHDLAPSGSAHPRVRRGGKRRPPTCPSSRARDRPCRKRRYPPARPASEASAGSCPVFSARCSCRSLAPRRRSREEHPRRAGCARSGRDPTLRPDRSGPSAPRAEVPADNPPAGARPYPPARGRIRNPSRLSGARVRRPGVRSSELLRWPQTSGFR